MENRLTSLELSEKLLEAGCNFRTKKKYFRTADGEDIYIAEYKKEKDDIYVAPAYDLLWDVCVKYAKEFWGARAMQYSTYGQILGIVCSYLKYNKKQEAEEYIWEHCLFNEEKKEK